MPSAAVLEPATIGRVVAYHRPMPASATRLVVLHGALRSTRDLVGLCDRLPEQEMVLVDLPGHGQAPHSAGGYGAEALAVAVQAVLSHYSDPRPVLLLAESFSGLTALQLATLNTDIAHRTSHIAHVALIDTPLDTARMLASQQVLLGTWMKQPAMRDMITDLSRDFFGLDVVSRTVVPRTYHHYLQKCPVPITMITGALKSASAYGAGAFFNEQDRALLQGHRQLTVMEIPAAGHSVFRLQPEAVVKVISSITASLGSAEA